jgi:regulator of RNase E activity RraA
MSDGVAASAQPRHRILQAPAAPPATLVEALRACATANLADGLPHQVQVATGLVPRHAAAGVLCGPALTVRVAAGDNLLAQHAIDLARPGDVIVIDGAAGAERALVGETMARWAHACGVAGFVVDGAVRDLDYLCQGPLPVYSRSVSPRGPTRTGGGEVYGEVCVGGAVVRAGDLVVGDLDGVACVPQALAQAAIDGCLQLMARERETFEAIRRGTLSRAWIAQALGGDVARNLGMAKE